MQLTSWCELFRKERLRIFLGRFFFYIYLAIGASCGLAMAFLLFG